MFPSVKVLRRTPAPDPGERQHALARLNAASLTPVRRESSRPPGWVPKGPVEPAVDEVGRDEVVRGGWVPESVLPERLRGSRWGLAPRHVAVVVAVLVVGLGWALW